MNTLIDCPDTLKDAGATWIDVESPRGAAPRTVPCAPWGVEEDEVVRFCPDCGSPVRIAGVATVVPCRGCGVVHGAKRFAACRASVAKGPAVEAELTRKAASLGEVVRELVALVAYLWDPNAYAWVKGFLAVRGCA